MATCSNVALSQCKLTGFLPIHAVVANGLNGMYDWLTTLDASISPPIQPEEEAPAASVDDGRQPGSPQNRAESPLLHRAANRSSSLRPT